MSPRIARERRTIATVAELNVRPSGRSDARSPVASPDVRACAPGLDGDSKWFGELAWAEPGVGRQDSPGGSPVASWGGPLPNKRVAPLPKPCGVASSHWDGVRSAGLGAPGIVASVSPPASPLRNSSRRVSTCSRTAMTWKYATCVCRWVKHVAPVGATHLLDTMRSLLDVDPPRALPEHAKVETARRPLPPHGEGPPASTCGRIVPIRLGSTVAHGPRSCARRGRWHHIACHRPVRLRRYRRSPPKHRYGKALRLR